MVLTARVTGLSFPSLPHISYLYSPITFLCNNCRNYLQVFTWLYSKLVLDSPYSFTWYTIWQSSYTDHQVKFLCVQRMTPIKKPVSSLYSSWARLFQELQNLFVLPLLLLLYGPHLELRDEESKVYGKETSRPPNYLQTGWKFKCCGIETKETSTNTHLSIFFSQV